MNNLELTILFKLWDMQGNVAAKKTLRKHWSKTAVFTDSPLFRREKAVPREKLLPGELSAVIFRVGCYKVRSAQRIYNVDEPGYSPENETPATREDVEMVRKDTDNGKLIGFWLRPWRDRLRITHEISAKHVNDRKGEYTVLCRAAEARSGMWCERISTICSAKKDVLTPDSKACLFVCNAFMGDSHGAETWYKFNPSGKVERLYLHDYDLDQDSACFN